MRSISGSARRAPRIEGTRRAARCLQLGWSAAGALALASVLTAVVPACGTPAQDDASAELTFELTFDPDPPRVGPSRVTLELSDAAGEPVEGASLRLEGNMNHAGMVPVFADASEVEPGRYAAELEFTMGGDWIVLVDAKTPEGHQQRWRETVSGVRSD